MVKRGLVTACAILCAAPVGTAEAHNNMSGPTLDAVRARGQLNCGVALPDTRGEWQGLDVEMCRGLADAIFNAGTPPR